MVFPQEICQGEIFTTKIAIIIKEIITKVRNFDAFDENNDPYNEHDFGAFDYKGKRIFWKIDYYDQKFLYLSPDVSNPRVTNRVLTIMYAEEY